MTQNSKDILLHDYIEIGNIKIEGETYLASDFRGTGALPLCDKSPFHRQLSLFLQEWFAPTNTIKLHTSGSTGLPKEIIADKTKMLQSAKKTCDFFSLRSNHKALLCLPLEYIAGKMMVVRALYAGLDLYPIPPDGQPLSTVAIPFDFAAMVPLQIYNSLQLNITRERLSRIRHLIIGGGAIDNVIEETLKDFPNAIYSTYGMTETLSHIALRRVSGPNTSLYYTPLASVTVALSDEGTLIVNAPPITDKPLTTNDIAEILPNGCFRILGRRDNVINSGGIKIQIEEVEKVISAHIDVRFAITAIPHPKLGEAVVMLIEKTKDPGSVAQTIKRLLPRHQHPLYIHAVTAIPQTGNGKIDRAAVKRLAKEKSPSF